MSQMIIAFRQSVLVENILTTRYEVKALLGPIFIATLNFQQWQSLRTDKDMGKKMKFWLRKVSSEYFSQEHMTEGNNSSNLQ